MLSNRLSSVVDCLLDKRWRVCNRGYIKFIGSVGVIAAVPGRPHEWYPMIEQEFKRVWFCCEHGVDWWFLPQREMRNGLVHYGAEVSITTELANRLGVGLLDFLYKINNKTMAYR
jgi:hypothetical protein